MKIWNVGEKDIRQLYNNKLNIIKANNTVDVEDGLGIFLLNKREVRGQGLVELKEGDNKAECYKKGRRQIFDWASGKYSDFEKHCEERESQRLHPLMPHKEILEYKKIIDDYNKWVVAGESVKEEYKEIVGEKKVFVCPHCNAEFPDKLGYFSHIPSHAQGVKNGNVSVAEHTSQGKN